MANVQVFENPEFGSVRVIGDLENPLFCLSDVCKVLELPQVAKVIQRLDDGVLSKHPLETAGGVQQMYFINEEGLYDVVLESRKPHAKKFRKWLVGEVAISVRKTGMYINPQAQISPAFLRQIADKIEELEAKTALLETQNAELQPKASYYDLVLQCKDLISVSTIAKDYGYSAITFNKILEELDVQFNQSGIWLLKQKYACKGWTSTKTHPCTDAKGNVHCKVHTYWTQKGRLGLYDLLKQHGYLPTIEKNSPCWVNGQLWD